MYNYFTNQRKKHQTLELQCLKTTQQKHTLHKQQKDKRLIKRYIERTTHGYERMLDTNKQIIKYKEYQHQFREFNKDKNIGPPSFYFKQRNDKERIYNAIKGQEDLDYVPFNREGRSPTRHKFRENKSQHDFKYTSFNTVSRVVENIGKQITNEVPTSWDINIRKFLKTQRDSAHHTRSQTASNKHNRIKNKQKQLHTQNTHENSQPSLHEHSHPHPNPHPHNLATSNTTVMTLRNKKNTILPLLNIKHHPKSIQSIDNKLVVGALKNTALIECRKSMNDSIGKNIDIKDSNNCKGNRTLNKGKINKIKTNQNININKQNQDTFTQTNINKGPKLKKNKANLFVKFETFHIRDRDNIKNLQL